MPMSTLQCVNSILAAMEWELLLSGLGLEILHRKASQELSGTILNGEARRMSKGKIHRAVHMVFPIVCGFIERVTGIPVLSNMTRGHVPYSLLMIETLSGSCK